MHFTPTYSSWNNQVERFSACVTADPPQRSDHRSVQALEADIRKWITGWNENPKPFIRTKPAEEILESLKRLLKQTTGAEHYVLRICPGRISSTLRRNSRVGSLIFNDRLV